MIIGGLIGFVIAYTLAAMVFGWTARDGEPTLKPSIIRCLLYGGSIGVIVSHFIG
ncbi:MAG: hypothetical protein ACKOXK_03910 [Chakrabartia sp.]